MRDDTQRLRDAAVLFFAGLVAGSLGALLLVRPTLCPSCVQKRWLDRYRDLMRQKEGT